MARKSSAADAALRATLTRDALREDANDLAARAPSDNRGGRFTKWEREVEALGKRLARAERAAEKANASADIQEPAPRRARKPTRERESKPAKKGAKKRAKKPAAPKREREPGSPSWEIGVNYRSDRSRSSNVMVNIRIQSRDGEPISREEAQRIMTQLHNGATPDRLPENIEVIGVDWSRPKWGGNERSGDDPERDLYNFRYILGSVPADEYRLNIPEEPFQ